MSYNIKQFLISTILLLMIVFSSISIKIAWFTDSYDYQQDILGSTRTRYFAGGEGSEFDPYIIQNPEHFFNLSMLNELGFFDTQTFYFKIANAQTGAAVDIDFSDPNLPEYYRIIKPIGDHIYPFKGVIDGNNSIIRSITIDSSDKQDIGVFGYLTNGASVSNLFMAQPTIVSNPQITDDQTGFHLHNNDNTNRATGYIVGHLGNGAMLNNIYVIQPTIQSLSNGDTNRSQYGLIGFNEADGGIIPGSPRSSYNFILDGPSAYNAITYAQTTYANYYINGGSVLRLNDVLSFGTLASGYSLSTLRISNIPNDPNPVFLYDQLVLDGYTIGSGGSEYKRENIDVVGVIDFNVNSYQIFQNLSAFTTPVVNSVFNPNNHPDAVFLYVKPTNTLQDLGNVTGIYGGGGNLSYLSGYDTNGNYVANRSYKNKNSVGVIDFGASGLTQTMSAINAWTAVVIETDPNTGEEIMRVVDETVTPDYYVFLLAVTNGQILFDSIEFEYLPPAPDIDDFETVGTIDFINENQIQAIINDPINYEYSLLYYNYEIIEGQGIEIFTDRISNNVYDIYIDYNIIDTSFFYFDIFNIKNNTVNLYINGNLDNSYSNAIIAIKFENGSYDITLID